MKMKKKLNWGGGVPHILAPPLATSGIGTDKTSLSSTTRNFGKGVSFHTLWFKDRSVLSTCDGFIYNVANVFFSSKSKVMIKVKTVIAQICKKKIFLNINILCLKVVLVIVAFCGSTGVAQVLDGDDDVWETIKSLQVM